MSRSSARRGQTEPLAALAAVVVVGLALALYVDVLAAVEPSPPPEAPAAATLQEVHESVTEDGAARPGRLSDALSTGPPGYDVNVTLSSGPHRWSAGPVPPASAAAASRRTAVSVGRWTTRPGRLGVVVWS